MKKKIIALALISASLMSASEPLVYICTGPQSKRYHKTENCYGLNSCSEDIIQVTKAKATSIGRTPCGICYKRK